MEVLNVIKYAPIILALLLTACASPQISPNATNFDEQTYQSDLFECRGGTVLEAAADSISVATFGAVMGVFHGAPVGVAAGNGFEGAIIGAAVGAVIGLGVGAAEAIEKHEGEIVNCLRDKGYEVSDMGYQREIGPQKLVYRYQSASRLPLYRHTPATLLPIITPS